MARAFKFLWPEAAVQRRPTSAESGPYVRSYLLMRLAVGFIALVIPFLLMFGEPAVFDGQPFLRGSLSAYYYSGMREVFVGLLCAIGLFLIIYKLLERTREARLSTYAGIAVITLAWFPTGRPGKGVTPTPLQAQYGETGIEWTHYIASAVFLSCLAGISLLFALLPPPKGRRPPVFWQRYHRICASLILAGMALAVWTLIFNWPQKGLLVGEVVAVWAFSASWLMKGWELIDPVLGRWLAHVGVGEHPA